MKQSPHEKIVQAREGTRISASRVALLTPWILLAGLLLMVLLSGLRDFPYVSSNSETEDLAKVARNVQPYLTEVAPTPHKYRLSVKAGAGYSTITIWIEGLQPAEYSLIRERLYKRVVAEARAVGLTKRIIMKRGDVGN